MHRHSTYHDAIQIFGGNTRLLSNTFLAVAQHIHDTFCHVLTDWNRWQHLLPTFAACIHDHIGTYENCVGFIDGKLWDCCRPVRGQEHAYNGHHRQHGVKTQSVVFPNGMIGHFWGPMNGNRHDSHMLRESRLVRSIRTNNTLQGTDWCVYGDPAYPLSPEIQAPFRGVGTAAQQAFNTATARFHTSVEWGFGRVVKYWPFLADRLNMKTLEGPVAVHIFNGVLMTNILTILDGSGSFYTRFHCHANLTLDEYLAA